MRNITFYSMTALILGILTAYFELLTFAMAIALSPVLFWCFWKMRGRKNQLIMILIISFFVYGLFSYRYYFYNPLEEYYDCEVRVSGTILEINRGQEKSQYQSFVLDAEVNTGLKAYHEKMIVYLRDNNSDVFNISRGMFIDGYGEMIAPSKATNFGEFDYKQYLNIKGIKGIVFLDEFYLDANHINHFNRMQNFFINHIEELIDENLGFREASLLKGIVLGNSDYIDEQVLENIRGLGIAHVVAVSGLHVGILLASFGVVFKFFQIRKRLSLLIALLLIWFYGVAIGFPVSVTRALIMCSFVCVGILFHRRYDFIHSIVLSILLMLLYKPLWLFDIGFQLSFTAVISVACFQKLKFRSDLPQWLKGIYFLVCIQIFISPISIYYFNYFPLLSIISNLIFVPVITFVLFVTIISLITSIFPLFFSGMLLNLVNQILRGLIYLADCLFQLPFNGINMRSPSVPSIILYYLVLVLVFNMICYKDEKYQMFQLYGVFFTSIAVYGIVFMIFPSLLDQRLNISIIDVGQGSAALIRYQETCFMIDAGGSVSSNYEKADYVLPPYLLKRGVFALDCIFLTHYHADHYSGIDKINEKTHIGGIASGYYNQEIMDGFEGLNFYEINQGDEIRVADDFKINVLWPKHDFFSVDENRNSLVLLLNFKGYKVLFTGDIDQFVEKEIEESLRRVDVLIVPHHGSATASGEGFVERTDPTTAIFSYGDNSYGIPSQTVIDRYLELGAKVLSTYEDGEIIVTVDQHGNDNIVYYNQRADVNTMIILIYSIFIIIVAWYSQSYQRSNQVYEI